MFLPLCGQVLRSRRLTAASSTAPAAACSWPAWPASTAGSGRPSCSASSPTAETRSVSFHVLSLMLGLRGSDNKIPTLVPDLRQTVMQGLMDRQTLTNGDFVHNGEVSCHQPHDVNGRWWESIFHRGKKLESVSLFVKNTFHIKK